MDIIDLHNQGLSPKEIGEKLKCSLSNISKRLIRAGIKPIRSEKNRSRKNRYFINESYFDEINTSEKAYILGLMYADGSVHKDGFYIKMKDLDILLKVKSALNAEQPVKLVKYDKFEAYLLSISSQKLSKSLIKQNCFINKTYTLSFPLIKEEFYSHFIRGFFDGDGHLHINPKKGSCRIDFTSASTKILKEIRIIISSFSKSSGGLRKENGKSNAWHLTFSGEQVNIILDWFYKDATIYMNRKYNRYLTYKNVHVKLGELLENLEADNQQPSL